MEVGTPVIVITATGSFAATIAKQLTFGYGPADVFGVYYFLGRDRHYAEYYRRSLWLAGDMAVSAPSIPR
jgi:hypothetical protein